MNIYSHWIFPNLIDMVMSGESFANYRQSVLAEAIGNVLEIGFGTGLNLPYYPVDRVDRIATIDINPGMEKIARNRIATSPIPVEFRVLDGERLPMADDTFDTVVSTWTLCSIERFELAIGEIYRVLKSGGKFLFIEHGASNEPNVLKWQQRLTPIQKIIGDGCHLDRHMRVAISQHFDRLEVNEFYLPDAPKIGGYFYQGVAIK